MVITIMLNEWDENGVVSWMDVKDGTTYGDVFRFSPATLEAALAFVEAAREQRDNTFKHVK